ADGGTRGECSGDRLRGIGADPRPACQRFPGGQAGLQGDRADTGEIPWGVGGLGAWLRHAPKPLQYIYRRVSGRNTPGLTLSCDFQDPSSWYSASGVFVGAVAPAWSTLFNPWHEAQTRTSPGWNVTHRRSRTTGVPVASVICQVIARRAGMNAAT